MDSNELGLEEQNSFQFHENIAKKWRILVYFLLLCNLLLCILVLSLDAILSTEGLGATKKYLGFVQSISGIILVFTLTISILYHFKTLVLVYIVCSDILSLACGIMFILLELSADIQYYNGEAPLQPAHTKSWFRIYRAYFIFSLTLAAFTIFQSFFAYKIRQNISIMQKNSLLHHIKTRHSSGKKESLLKKNENSDEEKNKNQEFIINNNFIGINNNNTSVADHKNPSSSYNKKNNQFNNKENKNAIEINESQEKSIQNSIQSSIKIKLPNSQTAANHSLIEEKKEDLSEFEDINNKTENTKTIISEFNKQDIENFLLDTPETKNFKSIS